MFSHWTPNPTDICPFCKKTGFVEHRVWVPTFSYYYHCKFCGKDWVDIDLE